MDNQPNDKNDDSIATGLNSVAIDLAPKKLGKPGREDELTSEELVTYAGEAVAC